MVVDLKTRTTNRLETIADQFAHQGKINDLQPFGSGNINDTYLVSLDNPTQKSDQQTRFVLQRINTQVFRQPQLVMRNMCLLTEHVHQRLQHQPLTRRWEMPRVILTQTGQDHWQDGADCWRAISFVEGSESFDALQNPSHAREVGYALGMFHNLISDLPADQLADTLPGFHITPLYLKQYQQLAQTKAGTPDSPDVRYCQQFIEERQNWVPVLENARAEGKLPLRLMHGDPKLNNVMFDRLTGQAVSVIDLDTVKPGLIHYDIGDCLRSGCNPIGEETPNWQQVYFEPDLCREILQGYIGVARAFMTANDYAYLFDAARLIAFELGLRFFTDYLAGNVYFKVKYPEHNLLRALVQFKLTESIEAQEADLQKLIRALQ